jgi:hypothetical protein
MPASWRTGTTLPIALTVSLLAAPIVAEAQPTGKPLRSGLLDGPHQPSP